MRNILVVDGYISKSKFLNGVSDQTGLTIICRLRDDANLNYLYLGPKSKGRGRPKKHDGKVNTKKVDKRRIKLCHSDTNRRIYQGVVFSKSLKRNIKLSYVEFLDDR